MDILKYTVKKRKLSNVITYQTALGDQKGMIEMVMPKDGKTRLHGLSHVVHDSIREWNNGQRFEVSCDTVDNLFGQLDVQGIKIDVENFEYFVLKGAQNLIKRCKPVIYAELWDNDNRKKCFELMKNLNYGIYCVQDQKITPWNKNIQTQNFIFKPE
jgi:FkbM family methyltransferase